MRTMDRWTGPTRAGKYAGYLVFVSALVLFAVLTVPSLLASGQALFPDPDAPEYLAGALGLLTGHGHAIPLGDHWLPSRYPPGYSLSIAAALAAGVSLRTAPFLVSVASGFLIVALVFLAGGPRGGRRAGALAALLLASSPALVVLARSPMSDALAALFVVAAFLALLRSTQSAARGWGVLAGVCLGLAITTRISNVLFVPLLGLAVLGWPASPAQRARRWAQMHAALAVSLVPLALANVASFGRPLGNGYAYWAPAYADVDSAFGLQYVPLQARLLLREVLQMEWRANLASHYAAGSYLEPASLALVAWTLVGPGATRAEQLLLAGTGLYAAAMALYFYPDPRFYCPALLCALVVAARALERTWTSPARLSALPVVLLLAHVVGFPGPRSLSGTWDLARSGPGAASEIEAAADELRALTPGLVFTDHNPVDVRLRLGEGWNVLPASEWHVYDSNPDAVRSDAPARRRAIEAALADGRPVYRLLAHRPTEDAPTLVQAYEPRWASVATLLAGSAVSVEVLRPQR